MTRPRIRESDILYASFCTKPSFAEVRKRRTAIQRRGLAFERKALSFLHRELGESLSPKQWIEYGLRGERRPRFAEIDAVWRLPSCIILFEIKLSHTIEAERQLFDLYRPLTARLHPPLHPGGIVCCEIVRSFDSRVPTKRGVRVFSLSRLMELKSLSPDELGVLLWPLKE